MTESAETPAADIVGRAYDEFSRTVLGAVPRDGSYRMVEEAYDEYFRTLHETWSGGDNQKRVDRALARLNEAFGAAMNGSNLSNEIDRAYRQFISAVKPIWNLADSDGLPADQMMVIGQALTAVAWTVSLGARSSSTRSPETDDHQ